MLKKYFIFLFFNIMVVLDCVCCVKLMNYYFSCVLLLDMIILIVRCADLIELNKMKSR